MLKITNEPTNSATTPKTRRNVVNPFRFFSMSLCRLAVAWGPLNTSTFWSLSTPATRAFKSSWVVPVAATTRISSTEPLVANTRSAAAGVKCRYDVPAGLSAVPKRVVPVIVKC